MIETTIFDLINPLLAGGAHWNVADQGRSRPYAVVVEVVTLPENTLSDGEALQHSMFQISVWDKSYLGAKTAGDAVASAINAAFSAGTLAGVQISKRGRYEPDTAMHGFMYEYSFWH